MTSSEIALCLTGNPALPSWWDNLEEITKSLSPLYTCTPSWIAHTFKPSHGSFPTVADATAARPIDRIVENADRQFLFSSQKLNDPGILLNCEVSTINERRYPMDGAEAYPYQTLAYIQAINSRLQRKTAWWGNARLPASPEAGTARQMVLHWKMSGCSHLCLAAHLPHGNNPVKRLTTFVPHLLEEICSDTGGAESPSDLLVTFGLGYRGNKEPMTPDAFNQSVLTCLSMGLTPLIWIEAQDSAMPNTRTLLSSITS